MTDLSQSALETQTQSNFPAMIPRELTLIVAATNQMGIGVNNALPWKGLKNEMAYFARITKRAPPGVPSPVLFPPCPS